MLVFQDDGEEAKDGGGIEFELARLSAARFRIGRSSPARLAVLW